MHARYFAAAVLATGLVSFAPPSSAMLLNCPAGFTAGVTAKVENAAGTTSAANGCQYLDPPDQSNVANLTNINTAGFFGHSDWQSNGQTQLSGAGSIGLTGTWSIANANFAAFDYIMVFKDGSDTNLVAFAFNELYSSGLWSSPFENPPFTNLKDDQVKAVSHLSIFKRGGEQRVSEPGVLLLFGLGLLTLGFLRRKPLA
jgi:PEP-CTERM motif-containing protein